MRLAPWVVVLALAVVACSPKEPGPDVVATYRGGEVTWGDVLGAVAEPTAEEVETQWLEACREAASAVAMRRILVGDSPSVDDLTKGSAAELEAVERRLSVDLWLERQLGPAEPVTAGEVRAVFDEHRDEFTRNERRMVWNLYRRTASDDDMREARALLREVGEQVARGVPFSTLVDRYSQSETRLRGGRLGWIERGRLPAAADRVVFDLEQDRVSEPVALPGGLAVFLVSQIMPRRDFAFEDVRGLIARALAERRRFARLATATEAIDVPPGSLVIDDDRVLTTLFSASPEAVVIDIAGSRVTAGEIMESLNQQINHNLGLQPLLTSPDDLYRSLVDERLAWIRARPELEKAPDYATEAIRSHLEQVLEDLVLRDQIHRALRAAVDRHDDDVRAYFEANRFLYQSPLRLRIEIATVPLGRRPEQTARELDAFIASVRQNDASWADLVARLNGEITDLGWRALDELDGVNPKIVEAISALDAAGIGTPVQLNHQLHVAAVLEREEPQPMNYEEAAASAREDYLARHQQELFTEVRENLLAEAGFRILEDRLQARAEAVLEVNPGP